MKTLRCGSATIFMTAKGAGGASHRTEDYRWCDVRSESPELFPGSIGHSMRLLIFFRRGAAHTIHTSRADAVCPSHSVQVKIAAGLVFSAATSEVRCDDEPLELIFHTDMYALNEG